MSLTTFNNELNLRGIYIDVVISNGMKPLGQTQFNPDVCTGVQHLNKYYGPVVEEISGNTTIKFNNVLASSVMEGWFVVKLNIGRDMYRMGTDVGIILLIDEWSEQVTIRCPFLPRLPVTEILLKYKQITSLDTLAKVVLDIVRN